MKRTIRYILSLLLLMCLGVGETWGQTTDYSGTWYLQNKQNNANGYYLVPALGYYQDDNDKPFITTFQTNKDNNSIWRVEKVNLDGDSQDYYRFIHNATGKYVTFNDAVLDNSTTERLAARFRLHLQTFDIPTDATLFTIHNNRFHDRFLILDDAIYHFGASFKDLGKRLFAFELMGIDKNVILNQL